MLNIKLQEKLLKGIQLEWKLLPRANDSSRRISYKTQNLLLNLTAQLEQNEHQRIVISSRELLDITHCCAKQNRRLLGQLGNVISYVKARDLYVISYTENGRKILKFLEIEKIEKSNDRKRLPSQNRDIFDSKTDKNEAISDNSKSPSIYNDNINTNVVYSNNNLYINNIDNKDIEDNSNVLVLKDISVIKNRWATDEKNEKQQSNSSSSTSKTLKDFYPLSEQDGVALQKSSGREFTLNAMNQILLDMSKRLPDRTFNRKRAFMNYMTKVLRYEKRDAVKTGTTTFRIKNNLTTQEIDQQHMERYLADIESSYDTSLEMQFKKKIVSEATVEFAYKFLKAFQGCKVEDEVLKIYMGKNIEISSLQEEIIFKHGRYVYSSFCFSTGSYKAISAIQIVHPHHLQSPPTISKLKTTTSIPQVQEDKMELQKELAPENLRLAALYREIHASFPEKEACALTSYTTYQESDNNKVVINFCDGITLSDPEKDSLKKCLRKAYGDNVQITTKKPANDNSKLEQTKWEKVKQFLISELGQSVFNAWFNHHSVSITAYESNSRGKTIITINCSWFFSYYIRMNYDLSLEKAANLFDVILKVQGICTERGRDTPLVYSPVVRDVTLDKDSESQENTVNKDSESQENTATSMIPYHT